MSNKAGLRYLFGPFKDTHYTDAAQAGIKFDTYDLLLYYFECLNFFKCSKRLIKCSPVLISLKQQVLAYFSDEP